MTFRDKIEILLRRKGYKKTEFADKLGITYRALANYLAGARSPRAAILKKICAELEVTKEFLLDDKQSLILDSEERFLHNASEESEDIDKALALLKDAGGIFRGEGLAMKDKQSLFSCLSEIYFDAVSNK
ncbi:MAG: helix-turn-helix domain-containing protein [Bacteroides sp.]|nr:helix-turn-helix domain-containing protein [Bacteroides sp.]